MEALKRRTRLPVTARRAHKWSDAEEGCAQKTPRSARVMVAEQTGIFLLQVRPIISTYLTEVPTEGGGTRENKKSASLQGGERRGRATELCGTHGEDCSEDERNFASRVGNLEKGHKWEQSRTPCCSRALTARAGFSPFHCSAENKVISPVF